MIEPQKLLSPREVAEYFSVSPRTVVEWIKTGKLAATKPGGKHWRVSITEMNRLANNLYGDSNASTD